ncbi:cobalt-precorrin 5A hydrolase [Treponema pedis]|uniref:Cobalt-precorrin 5A hydrolase n=1 Tax=Treponema pedis TaxID=409322 RepID=A0A7S7AX23_9SPIR|nr:cobalt-precorrin 5A hydrolase [Treponema pedis]QOW60676.1 cobalt-precorrin 5A hydrolase [Treponema pedis]
MKQAEIKSKNIVCYSFTENAQIIGEKLITEFNTFNLKKNNKIYIEHFYNTKTEGGIKKRIEGDFKTKDALIFISSTGIAVRMIKNYIKSKTSDPAVIVIDDTGTFVISLLSGHIGGANELTKIIAKFLGAQAVITTASDSRNIEAVDLFAERNGYAITSMEDAKKITSVMVSGKNVIFYSDCIQNSSILKPSTLIDYPNLILYGLKPSEEKKAAGIIFISKSPENLLPENLASLNLPFVKLVPRTLNLGIGLRKGVSYKTVNKAVRLALSSIGKTMLEVKSCASIDLKKDEKGLLEFVRREGLELKFFTQEDIKKVENMFTKSEFVKKTVGVSNVSAPCAYLLGGKILLDKFKYEGVTVSISISDGQNL